MFESNRRRFLQTSLAAGTGLALGSVNPTQGDVHTALAHLSQANPAIRPGRVNWHADFAAACAASARSNKPVFHFHMMGRLDQRFC